MPPSHFIQHCFPPERQQGNVFPLLSMESRKKIEHDSFTTKSLQAGSASCDDMGWQAEKEQKGKGSWETSYAMFSSEEKMVGNLDEQAGLVPKEDGGLTYNTSQ